MKDIISLLKTEFKKNILMPGDEELIRLIFSKTPTQKDIDELLTIWDIEVKGGDKSIYLSYFQKYHPEFNFTPYESERLKGLLKYHRFNNVRLFAEYKKIGTELNKARITPLLIKSGIMKYLRPELPRCMGDFDIVVKNEEYDTAIKTLYGMGYVAPYIYKHSIDFYKPDDGRGIIDIHRFIPLDTKNETAYATYLFKRAKLNEVFGVKTLVPSDEDLMFITLTNFIKNITYETSKWNILQAVFDYYYFLKRNINWDIIKETAKLTGTEGQIQFATLLLDDITGTKDLHPEITNDMREIEKYLLIKYHARRFLRAMRSTYKQFKKEKKWDKYLLLKAKYLYFKILFKFQSALRKNYEENNSSTNTTLTMNV